MGIETTDSLVEQRLEGAQQHRRFSSENAMWWWCGRVAKAARDRLETAGSGSLEASPCCGGLRARHVGPRHSLRIESARQQRCWLERHRGQPRGRGSGNIGHAGRQATGCESRWVVGRSKQRAEQSVHKHEVLRAPSWQPLADAGATIVRMCVYEARRGNPSRSEADVARFIVHVGESGRRPPSQANRRKAGNHRQLVAGG
jgi:hypothetical protein